MPGTTARRKVARDAEIVRDRASGLTWARISERHRLTARQAQTVWQQYLRESQPVVEEVNATAALQELLCQMEQVAEDCALLSASTKNDSVKIASIKMRHTALADRARLMQSCGLLPEFGRWRTEIDMARATSVIVATLNQPAVPDDVFDAITEKLAAILRDLGLSIRVVDDEFTDEDENENVWLGGGEAALPKRGVAA